MGFRGQFDEHRRFQIAFLKERGLLGKEERTFRVLQNANLTEAERGDEVNYLHGDVLQFHQNAKGYKNGQRLVVGDRPLPLDQAVKIRPWMAPTCMVLVVWFLASAALGRPLGCRSLEKPLSLLVMATVAISLLAWTVRLFFRRAL